MDCLIKVIAALMMRSFSHRPLSIICLSWIFKCKSETQLSCAFGSKAFWLVALSFVTKVVGVVVLLPFSTLQIMWQPKVSRDMNDDCHDEIVCKLDVKLLFFFLFFFSNFYGQALISLRKVVDWLHVIQRTNGVLRRGMQLFNDLAVDICAKFFN